MSSMYQKAIVVIVFLMFLNGVPGLLVGSGVAEDMGVTPTVGGGDNIDEANQALSEVSASGGFANTLYSLYTSVTGPIEIIVGVLFGAEIMLMSLGVPDWTVTFVFIPKFLIGAGLIIYYLVGR